MMNNATAAVERYQRQELLGQGMMSVVWLARDIQTQEMVALKIMTGVPEDDLRNQKANERFAREIEIALSLRHPHILPVLDYGYTQYKNRTVPFLVSPFIPERSLYDVLDKSPSWEYWSLPQTADAIWQAAESLWYLHTRTPHIVHEDVKPGNFLARTIPNNPQRIVHLYLCDFGISRWQRSPGMMVSEVLGTFVFMAPEQAAKRVDRASDQYALAVMACYLLTGKYPIQAATNDEYISAHLHDEPILPSMLNPDRIPASGIDDVILKAMAKAPERRYPTIIAFAEALEQAIMNLAEERANSETELLPPLDSEPVDAADVDTLDEVEAMSPPIQDERKGERIVIQIEPLTTDEHVILDEPLPERPREAAQVAASLEEVAFRPLSLQGIVSYELPARPRMLTWSRDGNFLACTLYGHVPVYSDRDGVMQQVSIASAVQASALCWSPDTRVLAVASQSAIYFWDRATQEELPLVLRFTARNIECIDWSIRGQLAVWIDNQLVIYTLPYAALAAQRPPLPQKFAIGDMRYGGAGVLHWSPDGALLTTGASNGTVICWDVIAEAPAWRVMPPGQKVNSVAWSPDGSLLAASFRDNRVIGWNSCTREQAFQWTKLPSMPRMLSISTARHIAIASSERRLLCGTPNEAYPSAAIPGQLLTAWSPTQQEMATLDEQKENVLTIHYE